MFAAGLLFAIVLGQAPAADPVELVNRLGAAKFAEREKAAAELEKLGRTALPALRAARDEKDPEIRSRSGALLTKIEGALLTQPTMLRVDFENAPLPEVLKSMSDQAGIKLTLVPDNSPAWAGRKVSLSEKEPLTFWAAIDRLCETAHLQYNYGMHYPGGREPSFPLFEDNGRPILPVSDHGPFRVSVVGLHFQRDVNFIGGPQVKPSQNVPKQASRLSSTVNEQFYAQLQVTAEPRLALAQGGTLKVTDAVDDRGQVLVLPASNNPALNQRVSGYFGYASGPIVQAQASLNRPAKAGTSIKKLKGSIPLIVSTRKPSPLVISLASAAGRTFQNEDVVLTVHESRAAEAARPGSVEVTIRPGPGVLSAGAANGGEVGFRPDSHQQQIEVLDAQGHLLPWYQTGFDSEAGRLTMTFPNHEPGTKPAELRYYSLIRATADVPFEFTDLPLP